MRDSIYAQTCNCGTTQASGDGVVVLLDIGSDGDYDQNSANVFCIPVGTTYTGTIPASNGGSLTICGTWEPTSSLVVQINNSFTIYNNGGIDMGGFDLTISGSNMTLINNAPLTNFDQFELAESTLQNNGLIDGFNIYLHGIVTNTSSGTFRSTMSCPGLATSTCGFYVGDKGIAFVNDGSFIAEDFNSRVPVVGSGTVEAYESIALRGDYGPSTTDVIFIAPAISLYESNITASGTFYTDAFDCNNNTFTASVCSYDGTEPYDITSTCNGSSINNNSCLILPIRLKSYSKIEMNDFALLKWETEKEINFSHFELQSSIDGVNWGLHSIHMGKGGSSVYQSDRISYLPYLSYFRLKSIDLDGYSEFVGNIISISIKKDKSGFNAYPNPLLNGEQLIIETAISEPHILKVYTIQGELVHIESFDGEGKFIVNFRKPLASNTYIVELMSSSQIYKEKIVVQNR